MGMLPQEVLPLGLVEDKVGEEVGGVVTNEGLQVDLPGVIIADRNAASDWVRFSPVVEGLKAIDRERVFARYWTHPQDLYHEMSHKSEKCAEVLVPDCVMPCYLLGVYVANERVLLQFQQLNINLPICIRSDIFF